MNIAQLTPLEKLQLVHNSIFASFKKLEHTSEGIANSELQTDMLLDEVKKGLERTLDLIEEFKAS